MKKFNEAIAGKGKIEVDIDFTDNEWGPDTWGERPINKITKDAEKKYKLKFRVFNKKYGGFSVIAAHVKGEKKDILAYLLSKNYDMDMDAVEDEYPELFESTKMKSFAEHSIEANRQRITSIVKSTMDEIGDDMRDNGVADTPISVYIDRLVDTLMAEREK